MESEVGLDGLGNLALHIILSKLGPAGAVRVSRVSNRLRLSAFEDSLWAEFCAQELHLSTPQDHHGNPAPSFKAAYQLWRKAFAMYPWPLVKRVKRCWEKLKKWLSNNFPEAEATLRRGASESDIQRLDTLLKVKLPLPTRLLYRFHDGQELKEKGAHRHCLVRASAVFLPGFANLQDEAEKYFFAQSFRMSLLPEGCIINGMTFSSCQLNRRHWIIHNNEAIVSDVDGEALIGKYPLLDPGKDEFVYESCTAAHVYLLLQVLLKVLSHLSRAGWRTRKAVHLKLKWQDSPCSCRIMFSNKLMRGLRSRPILYVHNTLSCFLARMNLSTRAENLYHLLQVLLKVLSHLSLAGWQTQKAVHLKLKWENSPCSCRIIFSNKDMHGLLSRSILYVHKYESHL